MSQKRELWNERPISWRPIRQLIFDDLALLPRKFPHLTKAHFAPLSFQKMKVNLAAQVYAIFKLLCCMVAYASINSYKRSN